MKRKTEFFDIQNYTRDQIVDALLCPVNRDMTRREHGCDDKVLWENKGRWLLEHYVRFGGAEAWAAHRPEYTRLIEVEISVWIIIIEKINIQTFRFLILGTRLAHLSAVICR